MTNYKEYKYFIAELNREIQDSDDYMDFYQSASQETLEERDYSSFYSNNLGRIYDIAQGEIAMMDFFVQGEIGEEVRE